MLTHLHSTQVFIMAIQNQYIRKTTKFHEWKAFEIEWFNNEHFILPPFVKNLDGINELMDRIMMVAFTQDPHVKVYTSNKDLNAPTCVIQQALTIGFEAVEWDFIAGCPALTESQMPAFERLKNVRQRDMEWKDVQAKFKAAFAQHDQKFKK